MSEYMGGDSPADALLLTVLQGYFLERMRHEVL
jgi:hypothetical protein